MSFKIKLRKYDSDATIEFDVSPDDKFEGVKEKAKAAGYTVPSGMIMRFVGRRIDTEIQKHVSLKDVGITAATKGVISIMKTFDENDVGFKLVKAKSFGG